MSWYRVTFADKYACALTAAEMIKEFSLVHLISGSPAGAGIFREKDDPARQEATYFFSPAASKIGMPIIQLHSGVEYEAPSIEGIEPSFSQGYVGIPFSESR
jgi:hypothetical protein